jgi:hypothetical protein
MMGQSYDEVDSMRKEGEALLDRGFFEVDLENGQMRWANTFALSHLGYTLGQLKALSIFDLVPAEYHELLNNSISNRREGKLYSSEILAMKTSQYDIIWWYSSDTKIKLPVLWMRSQFWNKTGKESSDPSLMRMMANILYLHNDLSFKHAESSEVVNDKIDILQKRVSNSESCLQDLASNVQKAVNAAVNAANKSIETNTEFNKLKDSFQTSLDNQTTEILRLISSDSSNKDRMASFEKMIQESVKDAAETAVSRIIKTADTVETSIDVKTKEAGKSISKKITVPIGLLMIIATVLQWLLQNLATKH